MPCAFLEGCAEDIPKVDPMGCIADGIIGCALCFCIDDEEERLPRSTRDDIALDDAAFAELPEVFFIRAGGLDEMCSSGLAGRALACRY